MLVNLGSGRKIDAGALNVDAKAWPGVGLVCDLEQGWPFKDGSLDTVKADNVFEHLKDPVHTMQELYRVMKLGAQVAIVVPSTNGMGAFQDPTHKSFWNINSFQYYTDDQFISYLGFEGKFNVVELREAMFARGNACHIPFVRAILEKIPWQSTSR